MRTAAVALTALLVAAPAIARADEPEPPPPPDPAPAAPAPTFDPVVSVDPPPTPAPAPPPPEPSGRDHVAAYYTGFRFSIAPGFLFPVSGGKGGFVLSGGVHYGIDTGSILLVPELVTSFVFASDFVWTLTPGARFVFPISIFAPYLGGGAGPGYFGPESKWGAALRASAGFTIHPTPRLAFGLGAQYEMITGTDWKTLGPIITLAF